MKKITLILILSLIASLSFAQITLEHEYSSPYDGNGRQRTTIIKLELDGYKYCMYNKDYDLKQDSAIYLYNLDHSIYKTIVHKLDKSERIGQIDYVTQNLFNLDSKVELLISTYDINYVNYTKVISEDGNLLFSDSLATDGDDRRSIQNTPNGSKLLLNGERTAKIYSLPGKLELTGVENFDQKNKDLYPFPNPSNNIINIPYKLNAKEIAKVTITDYLGKVIKTYTVDNAFNTLIVNLDDLNIGTYLYTVEKERDIISQGKFIVSK
jgi:hypothetical protein